MKWILEVVQFRRCLFRHHNAIEFLEIQEPYYLLKGENKNICLITIGNL